MILLLFSGVIVAFTMRVNMSMAAPLMQEELGWSDDEKGYALSAFFWGYAIGQIPASRLAYKLGAKWLLLFSILGSSLLTLTVPVCARSSIAGTYVIR